MRKLKAKDVMNPEVLLVRDNLPVGELATFLVENEISGAPVLDADDKLVGVVTLSDLAILAAEGGSVAPDRSDPEYLMRGWEELFNPEDFKQLRVEKAGTVVRDIMSTSVDGISADASVAECARRMLDAHHHRLLVTQGDKLLGIITATDMLEVIATLDQE